MSAHHRAWPMKVVNGGHIRCSYAVAKRRHRNTWPSSSTTCGSPMPTAAVFSIIRAAAYLDFEVFRGAEGKPGMTEFVIASAFQ